MESTSQLCCVLICQFTASFPTSNICYKCLFYNDIFFMTLRLRSFVVCCITYENNVWNNLWLLRFVFVHDCDTFFISSQLRYLFVWCSYNFDDVRITLYLVRSNYVWKWCENYVSLLFVIVTFFLVPYHYVIYFFNVVTFSMTLERGSILVRLNYVWK